MDTTVDLEDTIEEPKQGMRFDTVDDIKEYYTRYSKGVGFSIRNRTSRKGEDGDYTYVMFACSCSGKAPKSTSSNDLRRRRRQMCGRTDCKARLCASLYPDGKWQVTSILHDHNHELNPGKSRFRKCNRVIRPLVKRRPELNDTAAGNENGSFLEKDGRNYTDKVARLWLGQGDAKAIQNFFTKMQANNSNFFYMMDLDDEGHLRNVFWADARSRATYEEFGDVITFDITYLTNKYDIPLAPFIGVNHHGQSMLLGCGLLSAEDTMTFTWLFQCWLACMAGSAPKAVITDQDKAMQKAIETTFPNTRHRWCLWHIMKKLPEKLRGYQEYESIIFELQNVVYDSSTHEEFEEQWKVMIEKNNLQSSEWLLGLYDERHRWVPIFLKDTFWAGMPTTQRNECVSAFFDGYVNSKTTLKEFVEQYEIILQNRVKEENHEDLNSFNSCVPCVTSFAMEKQFQDVYTTTKFKEFQHEVTGRLYCELVSIKNDVAYSEYEICEESVVGEVIRRVPLKVSLIHADCDIHCSCCLFESSGILCRHAIVVLIHSKILRIPEKYIVSRWRKDLKRRHRKVKIIYDDWSGKPEALRFDKMCNAFCEVADSLIRSEEKTKMVMDWIKELKKELKRDQGLCDNSQTTTTMSVGMTTAKESRNTITPVAVRNKGQPPFKRNQSDAEQVVRKNKKKQNNMESKRMNNIDINTMQESQIIECEDVGNIDGAILGTQDSTRFKYSGLKRHDMQIAGSYGGQPTLHFPNANQNLWGISQSGPPNMPFGGSFSPPMHAYGRGYGLNDSMHNMFSHQNLSQAQVIPDSRGSYGMNTGSNSIGMFRFIDATQPSNDIQSTLCNLEGDGRSHTGN